MSFKTVEQAPARLNRSELALPGSQPKLFEKAAKSAADVIFLDLEDAVAPDAKTQARDQIAQAVAGRGYGAREVLVRINALDSPWWLDDLAMAAKARPDGVLVPKVSDVSQLATIADRLAALGADDGLRVWIMLETAAGVLRARLVIDATGHSPRFVQRPGPPARCFQAAYGLLIEGTASRLSRRRRSVRAVRGVVRTLMRGLRFARSIGSG